MINETPRNKGGATMAVAGFDDHSTTMSQVHDSKKKAGMEAFTITLRSINI